tara:strand:+ start:320 stop:706 length:387 start_codon:yes stop_codon:yes gene_type:complete
MFDSITIPYDCVMLYNVVKLKSNVTEEDIELALGELCNTVSNTYGNDKGGFIGGQVFKFSGFISEQGSLSDNKDTDNHISIVTYWKSFEQHEVSHADTAFKNKFSALAEYCTDTYEVGYNLLWQGSPA